MKNSSPNREDFDDNQNHRDCGPLININVSHGSTNLQVHLPAGSTFGHLKQILEQKIGLALQQQKILFRGQEKDDRDYLHEAGVKDKSKVLVLECPVGKERQFNEINKSEITSKANVNKNEEILNSELKESEATSIKRQEEMSKAFAAISGVTAEVDKLAEKVAALELAVNGGTKIAEEELVMSSELLMRQLLKLDTIDAEGEARIQRKAEVCRIQDFHETLDKLKARNSKPISDNSNSVLVTTEWETFDSNQESPYLSSSSASTRITEDWETFD